MQVQLLKETKPGQHHKNLDLSILVLGALYQLQILHQLLVILNMYGVVLEFFVHVFQQELLHLVWFEIQGFVRLF